MLAMMAMNEKQVQMWLRDESMPESVCQHMAGCAGEDLLELMDKWSSECTNARTHVQAWTHTHFSLSTLAHHAHRLTHHAHRLTAVPLPAADCNTHKGSKTSLITGQDETVECGAGGGVGEWDIRSQ